MVFASLPQQTLVEHIKRVGGGGGVGQQPPPPLTAQQAPPHLGIGIGHTHEMLVDHHGPPSDGASSGYGSHSESPYGDHR